MLRAKRNFRRGDLRCSLTAVNGEFSLVEEAGFALCAFIMALCHDTADLLHALCNEPFSRFNLTYLSLPDRPTF